MLHSTPLTSPLSRCFIIEVPAVRVVENDKREVLHDQSIDRLGAEIRVSHNLGLDDSPRE